MGKSNTIPRTIFIFILVLAGLIVLFQRLLTVFYTQPDAGGVEGNIIYFVQRLLNGDKLYTDPEHSPFAVAQYTPLYYYIVAVTAKLFGKGPDEVLDIYTISRIISLLFAFATAYILYAFAMRRMGWQKGRSAIVAVASFIFTDITAFSRPDSVSIFLFFLGLYLVFPIFKKIRPGYRNLYFAGLVCASAILCKQNEILLPLLVCGWLIWKRRLRELTAFLLPMLILLFSVLLLYLFSGELDLVYKNIVRGVSNGFSPGWYMGALVHDFYTRLGLGLLIMFVFVLAHSRNERTEEMRFLKTLLIGAFVLANLFALKAGSHPGYLTEWWSLLFIMVGAYWTDNRFKATSYIALSILLALKVYTLKQPLQKMLIDTPPAVARQQYRDDQRLCRIVERLSKSGPVFTNLYTPETFVACILFRQAIVPQMDITGLTAYPRKTFSYDELIHLLSDGGIEWMLMRTKGPQQQFFEHRLDHFKLVYTQGTYNLYQYRR